MQNYAVILALACCLQVAFCVTSSGIVNEARQHIGSTKWSYASSYGTGANTNKCNQFVYDVLDAAGADPPSRHWWTYSPIGAGEWGNPSSSYLTGASCWNTCGGSWQSGDVISDSVHVGIITGWHLTTSAAYSEVVENDWGFRSSGSGAQSSITACWRYNYSC